MEQYINCNVKILKAHLTHVRPYIHLLPSHIQRCQKCSGSCPLHTGRIPCSRWSSPRPVLRGKWCSPPRPRAGRRSRPGDSPGPFPRSTRSCQGSTWEARDEGLGDLLTFFVILKTLKSSNSYSGVADIWWGFGMAGGQATDRDEITPQKAVENNYHHQMSETKRNVLKTHAIPFASCVSIICTNNLEKIPRFTN